MQDSGLFDAVEAFSRATAGLPDSALEHDWRWREYPTVRFAFLITYQELRDLAVATITERCERGLPPTADQQILAQHHIAARDLHGVLAGRSWPRRLPAAPRRWPRPASTADDQAAMEVWRW